MKDYLIPLLMGIMFVITIVTTSVYGQIVAKEAQALITRSVDELLVDKVYERTLIEKNLPINATVKPEKVRRLLIFDLNVNYGGHQSIDYANYAFARMGEVTGAFETVITLDTLVFQSENLKEFDAVFFNNTVGNLFKDKELRQNLLDFVNGGGGLLGVHGTTAAFTHWPGAHEDWPEFGVMLGARGATHRENNEHVFIRNEDLDHPVNRVFGGKDFDYRDEFFRFQDPYSRDFVHVLLSFDTKKTDMEQGRAFGKVYREDNDYAVAWIRQYGQGRVFYCTIAHHPRVFWDPQILEFYLDAIQYAFGDI
ncbi:ThuA domain-containing protein [Bacteroidota bacterium]